MNFKELNQSRLAYIVSNAVTPILQNFYVKNQKRLIIEGIKIQTIPKDLKKGVELFINLNDKAISIAREWFENHLTVESDISLFDAINTFVSIENDRRESNTKKNIELSKETITEYSKILFKEVLKKEPNPEFLTFMASEIPSESNVRNSLKSVSEKPESELKKLIDSLSDGKIDYEKLGFYELLLILMIGNYEDELILQNAKKKASENNIDFSLYDKIILNAKKTNIKSEDKNYELIESSLLTHENKIDVEDILVVGIITNIVESSSNRFIRVIGIIENNKLYELTISQKQYLFPDTGDIIWYIKDFKKPLLKQEIGIFKVTPSTMGYTSSPITSKYAVKEFICKLHAVRICNESLSNRSKLINWFYLNANDIAEKQLYVLADNQLIKPHTTINQKIDFDRPMDLFMNPKVFKIEGSYLSNELASSGDYLDLSPSEVFLKKLLKNDQFDKLNLTKNQINRLIEELKLTKEGQDAEKIREIIRNLDEVIEKQDVLDDLINKISETEKVKKAIDEIIKTKSSDALSKKNELENEIRVLEQQKNNLTKSFDKEKDIYKKLKISFSQDIKDIFQKGVENGRELLAESAFYQALITKESSQNNTSESTTTFKGVQTSLSYIASYKMISNIPLEEKLKSFPYKSVKTKKLVNALLDCCSIGMTIGLKGGASGILARLIAENLTINQNNSFLEIEMQPGVSHVTELISDEISKNNNTVFLIRNFDIAPISIYGHDMVDTCYLRALDSNVALYPQLILTYEDSGLGLDFPAALEKSMITIDLDHPEYEDNNLDLDNFLESIVIEVGDSSRKYFITKLIGKIRTVEPSIEGDRLSSLLGLLYHFYLKNLL